MNDRRAFLKTATSAAATWVLGGPPRAGAATRAAFPKHWQKFTERYCLPAWYDGCRVTMHAEFPIAFYAEELRRKHPEMFLDFAAERRLVHVVMAIDRGDEGAWWQSNVGKIHPAVAAQGRNFAKELIDRAHGKGLKLIAYHRIMEDAGMLEEHPDWMARDAQGKPYAGRGSPKMSFSSPYADFVVARILELVDLGVDGFYFDEAHSLPSWDEHTRRAFQQVYGREYPLTADPASPVYRLAEEFNTQLIERFFSETLAKVKARKPEVVFLISSAHWPNLRPTTTSGLLHRVGDSSKSEITGGYDYGVRRLKLDRLAPFDRELNAWWGYMLERDASDGRPSHVWLTGIQSAVAFEYITAAIIAAGSISNLAGVPIVEESLRAGSHPYDRAINLGLRASAHLAGTTPVRWAAIHISDQNLRELRSEKDELRRYRSIVGPARGAFYTFHRLHIPVGFLIDSQLEEDVWPDCRVLFLPSRQNLTARMKESVERFERRGGRLILQRPEWDWLSTEGLARSLEGLNAELSAIAGLDAPVRAEGGKDRAYLCTYRRNDNGALLIPIANEFLWYELTRLTVGMTAEKAVQAKQENQGRTMVQDQPPSNIEGMRLIVRHAAGGPPKRVHEALENKLLRTVEYEGTTEIIVPPIKSMAILAIDF